MTMKWKADGFVRKATLVCAVVLLLHIHVHKIKITNNLLEQ